MTTEVQSLPEWVEELRALHKAWPVNEKLCNWCAEDHPCRTHHLIDVAAGLAAALEASWVRISDAAFAKATTIDKATADVLKDADTALAAWRQP